MEHKIVKKKAKKFLAENEGKEVKHLIFVQTYLDGMVMAALDGHLLALLVVTIAIALLLVVGLALGLVLGVVHSLVVRLTLYETKEITLA